MADHITIHNADGVWVVRADGAVIAESRAALELVEGGNPPVIYFPRGDVAVAFLETSDRRTTCPHKGDAQHFDISGSSGTIRDGAWSYETPNSAVSAITGYIAFDTSRVTVERI